MSDALAEISRLAELGYRLHPCNAGQKTPATKNGCKDATCDIDIITRWWHQNTKFNCGLSTDELCVVDVDIKDGQNEWHTPEMAEYLQRVAGAVARTPRGGFHYFFRAPHGHDLRNTAGKIAPNVDTRANGGYVVIAPSATPVGQYTWVPGMELNRAPEDLPVIPLALMQAMDKKKDKPEAFTDEIAEMVNATATIIPEGQRNNELTSIGGKLRSNGLSQSAIEAALRVINQEQCRPPLEPDEIAKIATSVAKYDPRDVPKNLQPDPEVLDIAKLVADFPHLRPAVVARVMRRGETVNIIAKAKVGKSWFGYLLAFCVATGRDWLGVFPTTRGRVLILDNELHKETLSSRMRAMMLAMGVRSDEITGWLDVIALRGQSRDINTVAPILQQIPKDKYSLIIIDALYRLLPDGTSENDNAQMMLVFNAVDNYGEQTGAAIALIHHATKGGQGDKDVTDVGSGAGAISRAADTHLILRPHEENDAVVLDARLRSWEPLQPIGLRWFFPVWQPDDNLDPALLQGRRKPTVERKAEADKGECQKILDALKDGPKSVSKLSTTIGIGKQKLERLIGLMVHGKRLLATEARVCGNPCVQYAINPDAPTLESFGHTTAHEVEYDSFA